MNGLNRIHTLVREKWTIWEIDTQIRRVLKYNKAVTESWTLKRIEWVAYDKVNNKTVVSLKFNKNIPCINSNSEYEKDFEILANKQTYAC